MGGDPLHGGERVVGRRREAGLRRVPVVHRHDHGIGAEAQVAAERIVGVQAAEHPPTTVEVGDDGMGTRGGRPVEPVGQFPCGTREHAVDDLAHFPPGRPHGLDGLHEGPGVLGRQRLQRGKVQFRHGLDQHGHVHLQPADHPVVALRPGGPGEGEPQVAPLHDLVAGGAVVVDAGHVGQEGPRLARHVRPHVPGVRPWGRG